MNDEPIWTAETMNKKNGDTTLEQCGWCSFRGGGSYRYDCMISGGCDLLNDYHEQHERKWNSPCVFKLLGKSDVEQIIKSKQWEIEGAKQTIKNRQQQIVALKKLSVPETPPLPSSRPHDHFNLKDRVRVFYQNKWNIGTVVQGYRHHDGCVSYVLDDFPKSAGGWGCGYAVPSVMLDAEYEFFVKNPAAFDNWLKMSDKSYNGERAPLDRYKQALTN